MVPNKLDAFLLANFVVSLTSYKTSENLCILPDWMILKSHINIMKEPLKLVQACFQLIEVSNQSTTSKLKGGISEC